MTTNERTPEEDAALYINHAIDELILAKDALQKASLEPDLVADLEGGIWYLKALRLDLREAAEV